MLAWLPLLVVCDAVLAGLLLFFFPYFILLVTMQAQKEAPPDMQCKDKFLVQSVAASYGTTVKDITPEMVRYYCVCLIHMLGDFLELGPDVV